jgi:hypothetical protein
MRSEDSAASRKRSEIDKETTINVTAVISYRGASEKEI